MGSFVHAQCKGKAGHLPQHPVKQPRAKCCFGADSRQLRTTRKWPSTPTSPVAQFCVCLSSFLDRKNGEARSAAMTVSALRGWWAGRQVCPWWPWCWQLCKPARQHQLQPPHRRQQMSHWFAGNLRPRPHMPPLTIQMARRLPHPPQELTMMLQLPSHPSTAVATKLHTKAASAASRETASPAARLALP